MYKYAAFYLGIHYMVGELAPAPQASPQSSIEIPQPPRKCGPERSCDVQIVWVNVALTIAR
jgi:hypothetical protein